MDFLNRRRPDDSRDKKSRQRRQRGVASIEMITVLPVLLTLLFGTIEFGLIFRDWIVLTHSARVAARHAIPYCEPADRVPRSNLARSRGEEALRRGGVPNGTVNINASDLCRAGTVTVTASTTYQSLVLGAFVPALNTVPLNAAAMMRNENGVL
jgi:Flp pilus assembly protein TadG